MFSLQSVQDGSRAHTSETSTGQRGSEKEASARSLKIFDALAWWFAIALTGISSPETLDELRLYVRQEERRGRSTFYTLGSARRLLQELEELTGNEELEEV